MHSIWGLITALILVSACQSQSVDQFDADAFSSVDSQESWSELVETLKEVDLSGVIDKKPIPSFFVKLLLDVLKSSTFPTAVAKGISPQCLNDSKRYVDSLAKAELWALQSKHSSSYYHIGKGKTVLLTLIWSLISARIDGRWATDWHIQEFQFIRLRSLRWMSRCESTRISIPGTALQRLFETNSAQKEIRLHPHEPVCHLQPAHSR